MPSVLRIGCRVSGCVGPLLPAAPLGASNESGKRQRRTRERRYGVILSSVAEKTWRVLWDETGEVTDTKGQVLRYESGSTMTLEQLQSLRDRYSNSMRVPHQNANPSPSTQDTALTPRILLGQASLETVNESQEEEEEEGLQQTAAANNTQDTGGTTVDLQQARQERENELDLSSSSSEEENLPNEDEPAVPDDQIDVAIVQANKSSSA